MAANFLYNPAPFQLAAYLGNAHVALQFWAERKLILGGDPTQKLFETTLLEVIQ